MIELVVLDYLKKNLDVPVRMERPEEEPEEYVLVEKTSSAEEDYIYSATIVLQSYAGSLLKAAELNEEVKAVMRNIIALKEISSSRLNSDYNYTDQTKKKYRYQAIFDLYF